MALFDVGPVLEGISSLQGKLEDAINKTRLLLEAVEGSQSKYTELNEEYPVLRSLKGRLAASQGPNESLSTELVKFKLELETFVEEIFNSHDSVRRIRRNSLLQAKELEVNRDKLWFEKGELAAERKKLDLEREELNALRLSVMKTSDQETTNLNSVESADKSVQQLEDSAKEENNESYAKATSIETCDAECQTELETNLVGERNFEKEQDPDRSNAECQTEPTANNLIKEPLTKKEKDTNDSINKLFADGDVYEHSVQAERHRLLSCRPHTRQRVATAPVSRAKASLLSRQGHAVRLHKTLLDEVFQMKQEIQSLKLENTALTKRASEANSELYFMKNQLTVNIADRDELQKKLHKYKEQIQKLEDTLRKQACGLVHNKKQQRQLEEELRWSQILTVPLYGRSIRSRSIFQEGKSTKGR